MEKTLFRFVKQVAPLAQKLTDAALIQLSHPAGKPVASWKHAVLLYLREHMDAEYEEVIDWPVQDRFVSLCEVRARHALAAKVPLVEIWLQPRQISLRIRGRAVPITPLALLKTRTE